MHTNTATLNSSGINPLNSGLSSCLSGAATNSLQSGDYYTGTSASGGISSGTIGTYYPETWPYWQNQPYCNPPVTPINWYYHYGPVIDYDLLADKVAERIKGTKVRSKEDIKKEINKLLGELEKAK